MLNNNNIILLRTYGPYHRHKSTKKLASYTSAHITETVFAHDQHCEKQSTLSSPQLYRHSHILYRVVFLYPF